MATDSKLNQLTTSSCVGIFIILKDWNSLIASITDVAINKLNENSIINLVLFSPNTNHKEINRKILLNSTTRFDELIL